jgi:hypothetical protein
MIARLDSVRGASATGFAAWFSVKGAVVAVAYANGLHLYRTDEPDKSRKTI